MNERELQASFLRFLVEDRQYPEANIRADLLITPGSGKPHYRPDLVVIDPDTKDIIAIVELKRNLDPTKSVDERAQVIRYRSATRYALASTYLVYLGSEINEYDSRFTIYEVFDKDNSLRIPTDEFPRFDALVTGERAKRSARINGSTTRTVVTLRGICYFLASISAILFLLDLLGLFSISTQQLTLFGIFIALLLVPDAAKLRILGFEFERIQDSQNKRNE